MKTTAIISLLLIAALVSAATVTIDSVSYAPTTITEGTSTTLTIATKETSATGNASVDLTVTLSAGLRFSDTQLTTASRSFTISSGSSNTQTFSIDATGSGPQTISTTLSASGNTTISNSNDQQAPCVKPSSCTLSLDGSSSASSVNAGNTFSISASVTSCVCNYEASNVNVTIASSPSITEPTPTKSLGTVTSTSAPSPWAYTAPDASGTYTFTLTARASNANTATKTVSVTVNSTSGNCATGAAISTPCNCGGTLRSSGYCCSTGYSSTACTSDEGGASAGGAGGSSGAPAAGIVAESKTILSVAAGKTASAFFTKAGLAVTEIEINLKTAFAAVPLSVEKSSSKPALATTEAIAAAKGKVYAYLTITASNLAQSNINSAKIKFTVNRSWLIQNNIDPSTIALMRYSNKTWQKLATTKLMETEAAYYFEAETPGFSIFAIVGETKQAAAPAAPEPETNVTQEPAAPEAPKEDTTGAGQPAQEVQQAQAQPAAAKAEKSIIALVIGLLAILVAAGVYYVKYYPKQEKNDMPAKKK